MLKANRAVVKDLLGIDGALLPKRSIFGKVNLFLVCMASVLVGFGMSAGEGVSSAMVLANVPMLLLLLLFYAVRAGNVLVRMGAIQKRKCTDSIQTREIGKKREKRGARG